MTPPNQALKETLKALPPFEPPQQSWPRLQQALSTTSQRRIKLFATGLAVAASVLVAVGVVLRLPSTQAPVATAADRDIAALMQQSRDLEQDLAHLRPQVAVWNAGYEAATQTIESNLAVVDMQLNYAQPASARRLWQDRVALLDNLVETHQAASLQFAPPTTFTPSRPQPDKQTEWSL
ncbi:MAG: hypothetical protein WC809_15280 [Sinimarinibacterium sp.]|jgi:hypothetical protein